jgi:ribosomal protein S2
MLARSFTSISRNYRLFEIYSLVFSQITSFGVLVGHRLLRNYVYSSWMIYGFRHDLLIISISTFINMLRIGFLFLDTAVFAGSPIWFAGKDKIYSYLSEFAAISCGEFSCTIDWINGVLSNFYVVFNSLRTLTKLSKNIRPRKYINIDLSNWLFTRFSWPRVVFVASVLNSFFISSEATALKIPCIGIVDTNAPSQTTTIAIPGNDDSLNAVLFYNEIVSSFIMFRKAFNVLMWFVSIRRSSRVLTFFDWFSNKLREGLFFKNQPKSSFSDVNLKTPFLTNSNNFSLRFFLYRGTPFNLLAFSLTKFYKTLKMEKTSDFFNSFASSHHSIISSFSLDFFRKAFFKKYNTLFSKHLFYKPLSKIKYGFRPFFRGLKRFNANSKKFDLLRLFQKDFYTKPNQRKPFDFVRHSWNKAFKNFWQFNYNHCNSLLRLFFNFFFFFISL